MRLAIFFGVFFNDTQGAGEGGVLYARLVAGSYTALIKLHGEEVVVDKGKDLVMNTPLAQWAKTTIQEYTAPVVEDEKMCEHLKAAARLTVQIAAFVADAAARAGMDTCIDYAEHYRVRSHCPEHKVPDFRKLFMQNLAIQITFNGLRAGATVLADSKYLANNEHHNLQAIAQKAVDSQSVVSNTTWRLLKQVTVEYTR